MPSKRWTMVAAVLFLNPLLVPTQANQQPGTPSAVLVISVFNEAQVSAKTLAGAENRAAEVLSEAGIQVTWVQCASVPLRPGGSLVPSNCGQFSYPAHLSVEIHSQVDKSKAGACGHSWLEDSGTGVYASVSYPCVAASAQGSISEKELLGYVMAHEIGHLLLGPCAHAPLGVMRAHWSANDLREAARGNLYFTSQEEARLRSRFEPAGSVRLSALP